MPTFLPAACVYGLAWDQAAIWIGGWPKLSFESIYPLCLWLAGPLLHGEATSAPAWPAIHALMWGVFYGLFALAFWHANKSRPDPSARKLKALWWVQIALAIVWHGQYLYAVLLQAAYRLPLRRALFWGGIVAAGSVAAVGPFLAGWMDFPPFGAITRWYFPVKIVRDEAVFFVAGVLAQTVARQRAQLAAANAELHQARQRLAEAARIAERLRIAGSLSETLDRDLAALNRQLDLGLQDSSPQLAQSVGVAHDAGRQLFANIRGAIERDKAVHAVMADDLPEALRTLCEGVPQPRVQLSLEDMPPVEPRLAHSLYRCVQESITNAVRHAGAETLMVTLRHHAAAFELRIADDGTGMDGAEEGNGLRGMRARVQAHGGSMRVESGKGCRIVIRIPVPAPIRQEMPQEET
jgi:signal transduction histidine kinase